MAESRATPGHVWPLIAGTLTGLLWFCGGILVAFMNLGAAKQAPNMHYVGYAWLVPSMVLPFVVYVVTRRRPWIGLLATLFAPILSCALLDYGSKRVSADWRRYETEVVPKIVERHLPGVLPKGLRMGSRWYFPREKSAFLEGSYDEAVEKVASHIRRRLPSDWIEVRVKYFDDSIAEEYRKELLKEELGSPRFVSPRLDGRQNAIALGGSDDGKTGITVDIGVTHVMRGDVLLAKKVDGTPLPLDRIKSYQPKE